MDKIDIVVTYLNSNDDKWQEDYNYYKNLELGNKNQSLDCRQAFGVERYREWNNFRYWFRGVEKNCPWINKVFLIVQNERHLPKWLNKDNPRLRIVYHEEFIPKELLPTFSGLTIQFFISNIEDLSEQFIISDDDMFFLNKVDAEEFFKCGQPTLDVRKKKYKLNYNGSEWDKILSNTNQFIHRYMNQSNECTFVGSHLPDPTLKSFEQRVIAKHRDEFINSFKQSRFRKISNLMRFLFIDIPKIGMPETKLKRITNSKYIHLNSKTNLNEFSDCEMVCINDTQDIDDFYACKENVENFLHYKFPNKSSFELYDIEKGEPVFGIISWLPDDERRAERINRLNNCFKQIHDIFGDVNYIVIAQNWKDYKVPDFVNKIDIFTYDKLGILNARKKLRERFLESNYDYLIMCDDDIILDTDEVFNKDYFFKELSNHQKGFAFIMYSWGLSFCAISRYIYSQIPMVNVDPEKNEGYEDIIFPNLCHYRYPKNEFKLNGIKFRQNEGKYHTKHKSTWSGNHKLLHIMTDRYLEQFKRGDFSMKLDTNKYPPITKEVLDKMKWYEEAIWQGWCTREEYNEFKKKYGL